MDLNLSLVSSNFSEFFFTEEEEDEEEGEEAVDSGTMVKVGDDNTMLMNTASSVESHDTMIINSEAATLVESDLGTMVINSDDDESSTMKSESRVCLFLFVVLFFWPLLLLFSMPFADYSFLVSSFRALLKIKMKKK